MKQKLVLPKQSGRFQGAECREWRETREEREERNESTIAPRSFPNAEDRPLHSRLRRFSAHVISYHTLRMSQSMLGGEASVYLQVRERGARAPHLWPSCSPFPALFSLLVLLLSSPLRPLINICPVHRAFPPPVPISPWMMWRWRS